MKTIDALIVQVYFWNKTQQVQDGTSSVLNLLASCQQTCMTHTIVVYSEKYLMKDRGTARNMSNFIPKINLRT